MLDWGFLTLMAWLSYGVVFVLGTIAGWLLRGWIKKK